MADVKAGIEYLERLGMNCALSKDEQGIIKLIKNTLLAMDTDNRFESHLSHYTKTIAEMQTQINDLKSALGTTKKAWREGIEKRITFLEAQYQNDFNTECGKPSHEVKHEKPVYSRICYKCDHRWLDNSGVSECPVCRNDKPSDVKTEQTLDIQVQFILSKVISQKWFDQSNIDEVIKCVRSHKSTDKVEIDRGVAEDLEHWIRHNKYTELVPAFNALTLALQR